jgi:heat shock protein HslJ
LTGTLTTTNGQLRFEDLGSTEKLRRFYRVIER